MTHEHGNKGNLPLKTLSSDCVTFFTKFSNYVVDHAFLLPKRYPGYKDVKAKLLPVGTTKKSVWETYSLCCIKADREAMSKSKFRHFLVSPYQLIKFRLYNTCSHLLGKSYHAIIFLFIFTFEF